MDQQQADPGADAAPTGVNDLSPACFVAVFSLLGAAETARATCVHPLWAEYLRDDILWRPHLAEVYARGEPVLPGGGDAPSYRAAFLAWTVHFAGLPRGAVSRALHMWSRLEGWLRPHAPFIADTLRPGASAEAVAAAEEELGVKLPPAMQAILRVHDGQALEFDSTFDRFVAWRMRHQQPGPAPAAEPPPHPPRWHPSMVWGLFGGYSFYDHVASLRLFPLDRIVRWTAFFWNHPTPLPRRLLVVGASANLSKLLLLDADSGELAIGGAQDHLPAAPPGPVPGAGDGCLRWMEEWARRLGCGWYEAGELAVDRHTARGVLLFPVVHPAMATAVTRGLQVRVSSVFAPEMCGEGGARYFFTYCVRFRLLAPEEQRAAAAQAAAGGGAGGGPQAAQAGAAQPQDERGSAPEGPQGPDSQQRRNGGGGAGEPGAGGVAADPPLRRCQLDRRSWRILSDGGELVNEVEGEGVVGQYPSLTAGGPEFSYQSCTHQAERLGFMEGGFAFVEGALARPEGPPFTAVCPRFELRVPDYIY
ncbi:MAG: hypothetical protein J3K34DRAFT_461813 [Monoraphidium minutum]|nr:MAG: hypothetical protein J3K34DRAFT_461813 [Monoraphidium minutum]